MIGSILSGIIGMSGAQAGGNMAGNAANNAAMMQQQEATRARAAMSLMRCWWRVCWYRP
jgi:hypothetical protein